MFTPSFATLLSGVLAFSFLAVTPLARASDSPSAPVFTNIEPAQTLPHSLVSPVSGKPVLIADLIRQVRQENEKTVLLHLWAPDCPPCRTEMKELNAASKTLDRKGVKVIALAEDPDGAITVPAFATRYGIKDINLYIDAQRAVMKKLVPEGLPVTYLISQDGLVTRQHLGPILWRSGADNLP